MSESKDLDVVQNDQPEEQHISPDELVDIYKRIHAVLTARVQKASKKAQKDVSEESAKKLQEAQHDLYAYVRLMEFCQSLSQDVDEMRAVIDMMSDSTVSMADGTVVKLPPN